MSRDVVFNKDKTWKWNKSEHDTIEKPGILRVTIGEYGNQGIEDINNEGETKTNVENDETEGTNENEHDHQASSDQETNDDQKEEVQLRRSTRISKKPSYLEDYIYIAEEEGEGLLLLLNEEPWDFKEAIEEKVWRDACEDEINSIIKNKTWSVVDLPKGEKTIRVKWIFKIRRNADGSINKY